MRAQIILILVLSICGPKRHAQDADLRVTSYVIVSMPFTVAEYENIFGKSPATDESDEIKQEISKFKKNKNVRFFKSVNQLTEFLADAEDRSVVSIIGHIDNNGLRFPNGEYMQLNELADKVGTRTMAILSCNAKKYFKKAPAVDFPLTYLQALSIAEEIDKQAEGCSRLVQHSHEIARRLVDSLNKNYKGNLALRFSVATGAFAGTAIVLRKSDGINEGGPKHSLHKTNEADTLQREEDPVDSLFATFTVTFRSTEFYHKLLQSFAKQWTFEPRMASWGDIKNELPDLFTDLRGINLEIMFSGLKLSELSTEGLVLSPKYHFDLFGVNASSLAVQLQYDSLEQRCELQFNNVPSSSFSCDVNFFWKELKYYYELCEFSYCSVRMRNYKQLQYRSIAELELDEVRVRPVKKASKFKGISIAILSNYLQPQKDDYTYEWTFPRNHLTSNYNCKLE